jgi:hypothetical protein
MADAERNRLQTQARRRWVVRLYFGEAHDDSNRALCGWFDADSAAQQAGPRIARYHGAKRWAVAAMRVAIPALALLALAACGARALRPGERDVVEASGKKRDWVTAEAPSFREDDVWYFRGQVFGVPDLALGLRQAEADAKKRVVGKIAEQVASEYAEYALGANVDEGDKSVFVTDGISWASEAVSLSGVAPVKQYWEAVETGREYGVARSFNAWVLLGISADAYDEARRRAARALQARARAAADRKAEEAVERLRRQLRSEEPQ